MNFIFVVDSSSSMSQIFDKNFSFFDAAKNGIEEFIRKRESIKNKIKPDKYFLLNTNCGEDSSNPVNILSSWADTTDHLLFQLKIMKLDYSLTNISNSLQTGLNLLNIARKHPTYWDRHVYGRLISKIQNSYIILITDGGKFSTSHKIFRKSTKINFSLTDEDEIFQEAFSWDHNLISIIMNPNPDEDTLYLLKKYTNIVGGKIIISENFDDYLNKIDKLALVDLIPHRVNMYIEINNNLINIIQQNEIKAREKETNPQNIMSNNSSLPKIKFKNKNTFNKGLVPLIFDFKQFKQIQNNLTPAETVFDRNEGITFKEKWPLPDDFLMNKNIKTLQKKKSHPVFVVSNELQLDFDLKRIDYDEYEIEDKEFISIFLENYPDLTVKIIKEYVIKNNKKITWDLYTLINNSENILKKPFAVIKLILGNKIATAFNSINLMYDEISIFEYMKQSENESHIKLKLCVLPYNYKEFFLIVQSHLNGVTNKTEFIIQMEKYMMRIPFYYKPYIISYLEKKNLWKGEENYSKSLDEENLNESVIAMLKNISIRENEKVNEMNKIYLKNKQLHLNNMANCCGFHVFKLNKNSSSESNENNRLMQKEKFQKYKNEFLENCSDFENFLKKLERTQISSKEVDNYSKVSNFNKFSYVSSKDETEISKMGDFYENVIKKSPLRNPYLFDNEIKEFRGDYFGNPFRRVKIDTELYGNLNLDNPNINIKDGEILLINCDKEGENHKDLNSSFNQKVLSRKEILDEELSHHPGEIKLTSSKIKSIISPLSTSNQIIENKLQNKKRNRTVSNDDKIDKDLISPDFSVKSTKSARSDSHIPNKLQMQLIDDDLTMEFKEMFSRSGSDKNERNEIKINHTFNIDMNLIYDWKLKEKLKECKIYFNAIKFIYHTHIVSRIILESAKSSNKNILKVLEGILDKPFLFYTERQKMNFVKKVKNICEMFGTNKIIIQQINEKLNNISN